MKCPIGFFRCVRMWMLVVWCSANASVALAQNGSLFQKPPQYTAARLQADGNPNNNQVVPNPPAPAAAANQPPNPMPQGGGGNPLQPGAMDVMPPAGAQGLQNSWTYIPPTQARTLKIHDVVSIRVEESATSLLLGNATSRKTTSYDTVIGEWIRMVGLDTIKPAPQADGDPRVQTNQNEVYRGDSTIRTSESLTFNIAAQVVDIKPNGLIVLEANKTIELNDNSLEIALMGTCRAADITPDNTVLSRNLVNTKIKKRENGHVRDGYSRGWLTRLVARIKPF